MWKVKGQCMNLPAGQPHLVWILVSLAVNKHKLLVTDF